MPSIQTFITSEDMKTYYMSNHWIDGQIVCHFICCGKGFKDIYGLRSDSIIHLSEFRHSLETTLGLESIVWQKLFI